MSELDIFHGPNAGYALELYDRYRADPSSVDEATRTEFEKWAGRNGAGPGSGLTPSAPTTKAAAAAAPSVDIAKIVAAARVTRLVRELGHLAAHIDPLGGSPPGDPGLELSTHGLETSDLAALPASVVGGPLAEGAANALEALGRLRKAYSGSIGYEDDHIQVAEERQWLRDSVESGRFFEDFGPDRKRDLLQQLTEVETFERFLHQTFIGVKRFSLEGADMIVPMLDHIIRDAASLGTREVVMGMAHRGRLNVLAHILGKPYAAILQGFQEAKQEEAASVSGAGTRGYSGDVKYHLGYRRAFTDNGVEEMPITLAPNPSHLEFVNPVVTGRARAAQERRDLDSRPVRDMKASLCILIHGDAAFPGQGVVAETLNLSQLPGYRVGGTIHIILNNQIGFTTSPREGRSTLYASDLAKGYEIPIVHVNADDPIACMAAARMAQAYRETFRKDFLIDLVGYRRHGHNEGDEPAFTQPRMYAHIAQHPTAREIWARQLETEGVVTRDESQEMISAVRDELQAARTSAAEGSAKKPEGHKEPPAAGDSPKAAHHEAEPVSAAQLEELNEALLARPVDFTSNAKLEGILQRRRTNLHKERGIDWGHAEALAFASLLQDGVPIRLSGQDSERGTFGHRNSVLHDPTTGQQFCPLQNLPQSKASFAVYNSPLSETGVLGFEYGYSMHATETLVLWEAQFGDFINSAQVIVDQFIASGNAKWQQTPSLVLLLPHGYEGQGPEHSSARIERFLQLCADDNMRVVNCTTAAQYFHVLRRQAALMERKPRPLIVMTPKSLLRLSEAGSSLRDLVEGSFEPVIDDRSALDRAQSVTRLVMCSGKVYMDLIRTPAYKEATNVAVVRVEELYPFPYREIEQVLSHYPNLREVVWLQEEPHNMGAWGFVNAQMRQTVGAAYDLRYVGRPASASPAVGSTAMHNIEQANILAAALSSAPEPAAGTESTDRRVGAANVR